MGQRLMSKAYASSGIVPNAALAQSGLAWIIKDMNAQEVIEQIKPLPPVERAQVTRFVVEGKPRTSRQFTVAVAEDLDCSGLPEKDYEFCTYDEGFIAALLESFSGKKFLVKEVDCWCTGDRTCRFTARAVS